MAPGRRARRSELAAALRSLVVGAAVLASACGAESGASRPPAGNDSTDGGPPLTDQYDGIYSIVDVTLNASGCTSEGPSVLSQQVERLFFVQKSTFAGIDILTVASCADVAECKDSASKDRTGQVFGAPWAYTLSGIGPDGTGRTINLGTPDQGLCKDETIEDAFLDGTPRAAVRIEVRIAVVPDRPMEQDAGCTIGTADQGLPCSQLKVISGAYQEPL